MAYALLIEEQIKNNFTSKFGKNSARLNFNFTCSPKRGVNVRGLENDKQILFRSRWFLVANLHQSNIVMFTELNTTVAISVIFLLGLNCRPKYLWPVNFCAMLF